jgi:diguanylate cyclase (GGDEF)-like protein
MARVQTQLKVRQLTHELREMATHDGLTGVANRRAFDQGYAQAWRLARRTGQSMALLMVDVDHFKRYNDHYGHQAGDVCLQRVAAQLTRFCQRPGDIVARYGGEEFVLMLPDTDRAGAMHVAQSLLASMQELGLAHAASDVASFVTVSIGVASTEALDSPLPERLLQAADRALYVAKNSGRARASLG